MGLVFWLFLEIYKITINFYLSSDTTFGILDIANEKTFVSPDSWRTRESQ